MWTLDKPMASLSAVIYGVSWMTILLHHIKDTNDCLYREVREAWIRAKYIDRAFVRTLPRPEDHEKPSSPKTWSVKKWKRRSSPNKTIPSPSEGAAMEPSSGDAPEMEEKGTLAEGTLLKLKYYIYFELIVLCAINCKASCYSPARICCCLCARNWGINLLT